MRATRLYALAGTKRLVLTGVAVAISAAYITAGGALIGAMQTTGQRELSSTLPQATAVIEAPTRHGVQSSYTQADAARIATIAGVAKVSGFGAADVAMMKSATIPYLGASQAYVSEAMPSSEVALDETTAREIGVTEGSQLLLKGWNGDVRPFTVSTLTADGATPVASSGALVGMSTPNFIWSAGPGALHTLLVDARPGADAGSLDTALHTQSEGGSVIDRDQWVKAQTEKASSTQGDLMILLAITSTVVILVAAAAVSTTLRASQSSRMREAGLLRAIGASRRQLRRILLRQAVIVGAIASTVGVLLGYGVAAITGVIVQLSTGTGGVVISQPSWFYGVAGFVMGMLVTIVGVMRPAIEASRTSPVEAVVDAEILDADLVGVRRRRTAITVAFFAIGVLCVVASSASLFLLAPIGGIFLCIAMSRSAASIVRIATRLTPRSKASTLGLASDSVQRLPLRAGKLVALVGSTSALMATLLLLFALVVQIQPLDLPTDRMAMVVAPASQSQVVENAISQASPSVDVFPSGTPGVFLVESKAADSPAGTAALVDSVADAIRDIPQAQALPAVDAVQFQSLGQDSTFRAVLTLLFAMIAGTLILTAVAFASAATSSIKTRASELGVLRSIGMTRRRLIRMLTLEGAIVGLVGAVGGALVGLSVVTFGSQAASQGYGALGWGLLGALALTATLVTALATFVPAWLRNRSTAMPAAGLG